MFLSSPYALFVFLLEPTIQNEAPHKQDIWSILNQSIHGHLYAASPLALPCFSTYNGKPVPSDTMSCGSVQNHYTSALFRAEYFSGYLNIQDEICPSVEGDGCLLDNIDPFDSLAYDNKSCNQGSIPNYYIDVQEPNDVIRRSNSQRKMGSGYPSRIAEAQIPEEIA